MNFVTVGDVDLHWRLEGHGPVVVLAHGYCGNIHAWHRLIPALTERYSVLAYDARGHGLSTAPAGASHYGQGTLVDDLVGLLDALGIERADVVGHSMGGATALAFAARHPDRARSVVIGNIDGGYQPADPESDAVVERTRQAEHAVARERGLVALARQRIAERSLSDYILDDPYEQREYLDRYASQPVNGYLGVGDAVPWREPWLVDAATQVRCPAAIVAGRLDAMHVGAERLHAAMEGSRFVSIADAPHDSINCRPEAFNRAVIDFLAAVDAGAPLAGRLDL